MQTPWIVLGAGGHAKVLIDTLLTSAYQVLGYTDIQASEKTVLSVKCVGTDDDILAYQTDEVVLANGVGSVGSVERRQRLYEEFVHRGFQFPAITHASAVVARSVHIASGVQVMAGAVVQPECQIGENTIINTKASLDHDCSIGAHVHVAPGVTLSGSVVVGDGTHIGTGATVIQGIHIGKHCIIGAGAVVLSDIPDGCTAVGIPAKCLER